VSQITRRLRKTNREGAKESGGRECAPTLRALNDVDSMEVVCKDDDSPKPSTNELPNHISGYLSPRHGIGPKHSHTQSHLHGCVSRHGRDSLGRVTYHRVHVAARDTAGDPCTQRNTCIHVLDQTHETRRGLTNCKPSQRTGKASLPRGLRQRQCSSSARLDS